MKALYLFLTTIVANTFMCKFSWANFEAPGMAYNYSKSLKMIIRKAVQEKSIEQITVLLAELQARYIYSLLTIDFFSNLKIVEKVLEIDPETIIEQNLELEGELSLNDIDVTFNEYITTTPEQRQILNTFELSCKIDADLKSENTILEDILLNMGKQIVKNITLKHPELSNMVTIPLENLYKILRAKDFNSKNQEIECFLLGKSILDAIEITLVERFTKYFPETDFPWILTRLSSMELSINNKVVVDAFFYPIFYRIKQIVFSFGERGSEENTSTSRKNIMLDGIYR